MRPIIGRIQRGIGSQERKQGNGVRQKEAHDPAFAKKHAHGAGQRRSKGCQEETLSSDRGTAIPNPDHVSRHTTRLAIQPLGVKNRLTDGTSTPAVDGEAKYSQGRQAEHAQHGNRQELGSKAHREGVSAPIRRTSA